MKALGRSKKILGKRKFDRRMSQLWLDLSSITFDETKREGLHHEDLDFANRQRGLLSNLLERQNTLVRGLVEGHLHQAQETHFAFEGELVRL